jgi:2-methylcitrate dehydratase PrpD
LAIDQKTATYQDYLDSVSAFVSSTGYDDLPEAVRQHAKHVWMDTVGVIMGGSLESENMSLAQRLSDDRGSSTILRHGFPRADARNAALANGTAGTFLELDEGHWPTGHPSIYIVPAVLALGEKIGATGKQLIEALVVAYEISARIAAASKFIPGIHIHGNLGVIGATVGTARLLGYDTSRTREAINVASCLNGATPSLACIEGALVRNVYTGFSGQMGVLVPDLVESGFTGLRDGLGETYTKFISSSFDRETMVADLGQDFRITTNYFKLHAACRHLHSPIDAVEKVLAGRSLRAEEVEEVKVFGNSHAFQYNRTDPNNHLAAKFSVPFAVATRISHNSGGREAFQQQAVDDPETRALSARVKVVEDAEFNRRQDRPSRVEVVLRSGETLVGEVDNPRGDNDSPIPFGEVKQKFTSLTSDFFSGGNGAEAIELFMRLEETTAGDLTERLRQLAG